MPIDCGNNTKPRYRVKHTDKGNIRLAFCGKGKVVEVKKLEAKAKSKEKLGSN